MLKTFTPRGLIAMILVFAAAAALAIGVGRAQAQTQEGGTMHHAIGTFEVAVVPAEPEVVESGLGLSRYTLSKTFSGGMSGAAVGQMLAGGPSAKTATYIALERFVGRLDGREGAFLLAHRGDMSPEGYSLAITVVPNSGTGNLAGIEGEFALTTENGVHSYDLAYTLPQ